MAPAEANQLMKDLAEMIVKQKTQIEGYQQELGGVGFRTRQSARTTIMMADETKRQMAALQDEIKALEVRAEEEKRKAVEANLKLAQAGRTVETVERALCLVSPKGSSLDKRLATVDVSLTATIDDFAELKKHVAKDSDSVAASGLKKQLADLQSELSECEIGSKKRASKFCSSLLSATSPMRRSSTSRMIFVV